MPPEKDVPRLLLSAEEVAAVLGVSRTQVYAWSRQGILTSLKLGRRRRFPREAVEAFIAAQLELQARVNSRPTSRRQARRQPMNERRGASRHAE
jgi:excisionase family DNA binding protein